MKRTVKADYSRTCEGCRFLVTEPWLKDVPSFRCGADGRCKKMQGVYRRYRAAFAVYSGLVPADGPELTRRST